AHHDVMHRRRVLGHAELAEPAGRNVQLAYRLAAAREQGLPKGGIDPGAGDDAGAVPGAAPGEESALALDLIPAQPALVEQPAHEHVEQALVLAQVVLQPRDAVGQRAAMRRLGDAEEIVVVAALLARVLDHEAVVGRVDRGEADATNVLIEPVFERADTVLDAVRGLLRRGRRGGDMGGGAQHGGQPAPAPRVAVWSTGPPG